MQQADEDGQLHQRHDAGRKRVGAHLAVELLRLFRDLLLVTLVLLADLLHPRLHLLHLAR